MNNRSSKSLKQMRNTVLTFVLILCTSLLSIGQTKNKPVKKLDRKLIKIVKQLESNGRKIDGNVQGMVYSSQDTINGVIYSIQLVSGKDLNVFSRKVGSAYENRNSYHLSNYTLEGEWKAFHNINYGIAKLYDEQGHLIKEIDMDQMFGPRIFSFEELIKKMNNEYEIDLQTTNRKNSAYVQWNNEQKQYKVIAAISYVTFRVITIDGQTGDIISDKTERRVRH